MDKFIIGGLIFVRMIIMDLIFKKEFDDEKEKEYSV